ncbi:MAG TPA: heavy metal-binding domain-containing protein [Candidatus Binatia bacterium]|nr:heavy metal-binding domain-containing protein [Candidatus Binatia bacterium]
MDGAAGLRGRCERAREEAFEIMPTHGESIGGNAITGMRAAAMRIASGATRVLPPGTAVEPVRG